MEISMGYRYAVIDLMTDGTWRMNYVEADDEDHALRLSAVKTITDWIDGERSAGRDLVVGIVTPQSVLCFHSLVMPEDEWLEKWDTIER